MKKKGMPRALSKSIAAALSVTMLLGVTPLVPFVPESTTTLTTSAATATSGQCGENEGGIN